MASLDDFRLNRSNHKPWWKKTSTCWVIRLGEVAAKEKSIPNLYYTVDGRNPKQPPGMVFQSWWLAGFWDPSTVCRKTGWPYRSERNKASAMAKVHVKQTLTSSLESFCLVGSTVHWPPGLIKTLICCISFLWKMFGILAQNVPLPECPASPPKLV